MLLGIVGSEAAKFTPVTEAAARALLRRLCGAVDVDGVVSGACHLGGVDVWAIEAAKALRLKYHEFKPASLAWPAYKARNIQIAEASDVVHVVTLRELPSSYTGMRFRRCYHCGTDTHVKSGACWTAKYAERQLGKAACWHVIAPDGVVMSSW